MSMQVTIGFNPEALSAISELTAAIRGLSGGVVSNTASTKTASTANAKAGAGDKVVEKDTDAGAEAVTIYWGNHTTKHYGIVDSEEAYKALKKKDSKLVKLTETQYNAKLAELKAAEEAEADEGEEHEIPSEQDVIDAFGAYLPADLDKGERAKRAEFVKPMLARFGAKKASELPEEHRRLAINLVQRKAAGQDVDPETDDFEEFDAEESLV